jgi:hypothetical protein
MIEKIGKTGGIILLLIGVLLGVYAFRGLHAEAAFGVGVLSGFLIGPGIAVIGIQRQERTRGAAPIEGMQAPDFWRDLLSSIGRSHTPRGTS